VEKHLGKNIETICKRWGWGHNKLGEKMGLGRNALRNYIVGHTEPTIERLLLLERWTGISANRLYYEVIDPMEISEFPLRPGEQQPMIVSEPSVEYRRTVRDGGLIVVDSSGLEERLTRLEARIAALEGSDKDLNSVEITSVSESHQT
jgi:hypothetical protein